MMLACICFTHVIADDGRQPRYVNLNTPGALEKLRASNPKHYEMFARIFDRLNEHTYSDPSRWIAATFNAKEVYYSLYLLTSYPPLRDLSFTVDDTRYFARVTLAPGGAQVFSARSR